MSQHDKPDSATGTPAPAKLPPAPSKVDPVAAAEEHLANVDMRAQREALKKLSRSM